MVQRNAKKTATGNFVVECPSCGQTIQLTGSPCDFCGEPYSITVEFPGV
jgi:predicted amidophosphoribosyltransferase